MMPRTLIVAAVSIALAACSAPPRSAQDPSPGATRSQVSHVVLIKLNDANDSNSLINDLDTKLAVIPGIVRYWRGSRFESNRPEVTGNYDVGLVIDFKDAAAYDAYLTDPRHVEIVTKWKPQSSLQIFDVMSHGR